MFGRITLASKRAELLKEAKRLANQHRTNAMVSEHQALRAAVDARQSTELAVHYETIAANLESEQQ